MLFYYHFFFLWQTHDYRAERLPVTLATAKSDLMKSAHIADITVKCAFPGARDALNVFATSDASGRLTAGRSDSPVNRHPVDGPWVLDTFWTGSGIILFLLLWISQSSRKNGEFCLPQSGRRTLLHRPSTSLYLTAGHLPVPPLAVAMETTMPTTMAKQTFCANLIEFCFLISFCPKCEIVRIIDKNKKKIENPIWQDRYDGL